MLYLLITSFHKDNFISLCHQLAKKDADLKGIIVRYGHPPMWSRPNTFQTLILTILEQQVSLAAAYAAFKRLRAHIGLVTPQKILQLTDAELRDCYFTRQKIVYARELATAITNKEIRLRQLAQEDNDSIRTQLKRIKGIGDWTVDIYLLHVLQRADIFPLGDIALVNSMKHIKKLDASTPKEELLKMSTAWQPYRSIATMLFWHDYIQKKGIRIQG